MTAKGPQHPGLGAHVERCERLGFSGARIVLIRTMASANPTDVAFFGFTLKDVVGLIFVPIVAVLTTLFVQARQQTRDRRMQILRMLMATRHLPASMEYNASINLIPIEFNRAKQVMTAWRTYIDHVRFKPSADNEETHHNQSRVKQTKLITAIMTKMGLDHSEADIQADAYASDGFVLRDNLYLDSLRAQRDAAGAMKGVSDALHVQIGLIMQQMGLPQHPETTQ